MLTEHKPQVQKKEKKKKSLNNIIPHQLWTAIMIYVLSWQTIKLKKEQNNIP